MKTLCHTLIPTCNESNDTEELTDKLSETYKFLADYMAANKLVINADKTHLLVMGTQAMSGAR